jgi:hypothetical protein
MSAAVSSRRSLVCCNTFAYSTAPWLPETNIGTLVQSANASSLRMHISCNTCEPTQVCNYLICASRNCLTDIHKNLHSNISIFYHYSTDLSGERPFQCSQCPSHFTTTGQLQRHIAAVHEHRKRYKCNVCAKEFLYGHNFKGLYLQSFNKIWNKFHLFSAHESTRGNKSNSLRDL